MVMFTLSKAGKRILLFLITTHWNKNLRDGRGDCMSCFLGTVVTHTYIGVRDEAALVRSHMNDLQPLQSKIEQTTEIMPLALRQ